MLEEKMGKHNPSPNDQRSNSMNRNNPAFKASVDNRSVQLNADQALQHTENPPPSGSKVQETKGKE
jgi:hypothetical protein